MPSVVKLKNPKVMTFPGPFRCSQKLSRLDSLPQSEQHPKLLAKDAWERIGFRSQVLGTVILSVMLYPIIGDTAARKTNRMIMRPPPASKWRTIFSFDSSQGPSSPESSKSST